jgi:hypothetical protein
LSERFPCWCTERTWTSGKKAGKLLRKLVQPQNSSWQLDWYHSRTHSRTNHTICPHGKSRTLTSYLFVLFNLQIGLCYGYIGLVDGILERMIAEMGPATRVLSQKLFHN